MLPFPAGDWEQVVAELVPPKTRAVNLEAFRRGREWIETARTQPGRNLCNIPANAQALTGNVTTVVSGGGFLTLYPSGATRPTVASTNYGPNEIINNVFTVGLGADGAFNIFANATTDVVVDVTGYYAPPATGGLYFHPLPAPVQYPDVAAALAGWLASGRRSPLTQLSQQLWQQTQGLPAWPAQAITQASKQANQPSDIPLV